MGCSASRGVNTLDSNYDNYHEDTNFIYASPISKSFSSSSSPLTSLPIKRALSLQTPLVHHPPSRKGDSHHLVSLTSTTYGSLHLINEPKNPKFDNPKSTNKIQVSDEVINLSPDSVINTWELMDGLDDNDDSSSFDFKKGQSLDPILIKSSSFNQMGIQDVQDSFKKIEEDQEIVMDKPLNSVSKSNTKPLWKHLSEESFLSNMDPNVVSSYRRALSSRHLGNSNKATLTSRRTETMPRLPRSVGSSPMSNYYSTNQIGCFSPNNSYKDGNKDEKIVLYFTSLRGIRKTYEDCCSVNMIFKGFRVPVDEKDISMDSSYRKELQNLLKGKTISLPQVFIRGKHIGGVEEIRQLNESGELAKLLDGFPVRDPKMVCDNCGDARFLPCSNCNGSRKVFDIEQEQLKRCLNCNENGLIRCPSCCL